MMRKWLKSLVAGVSAVAIGLGVGTTLAQMIQRPLDPNTGLSAGVTYFAAGSEPADAHAGELAVRVTPGANPELVVYNGSAWVSPALGSTGQILLPNGQATAPALAFGGDTNLGIYWISPDTLGFAAGGIQAVQISRSASAVRFLLIGTTFANLGTPADGSLSYCSDCTFANPCAAAGTGALAKRLNGAWRCD